MCSMQEALRTPWNSNGLESKLIERGYLLDYIREYYSFIGGILGV